MYGREGAGISGYKIMSVVLAVILAVVLFASCLSYSSLEASYLQLKK